MNIAPAVGEGIPVSGDNGEVFQQAFIQYVAADQENVDPQSATQQIVMVQPITITADGQLQFQDGQQLDPSQVQILAGEQPIFDASTLAGSNFEQVQLENQTLQQLQIDSATGQLVQVTPVQSDEGVTHVQIVKFPEQQDPNQVQLLQMTSQQLPPSQTLPAKREEPEIEPPVGKGPYPCKICGEEFVKWGKLRRHLKKHDDDKSHRCPECSVSFNYEENLILHMATHNTTNTVCPKCGKKFSRMASLKAHLMLHEIDETLLCPECGDEFAVQSQLNEHLSEHRDAERGERVYACKNCPLQFRKISLLKEHSKQHVKIRASLHHKAYRRNIDRSRFSQRCRYCDKSFQKPSQLVRHLRIHTGERPYKCDQCDKAFNQKGALQIHMLKHTGEKEHVCQFCNKHFAQKGNLRSHIQRVHSQASGDEPAFQCSECTCVFKKLGSLNAHMSREHSDNIGIKLTTSKNDGGGDPAVARTSAAPDGQSEAVTGTTSVGNNTLQQLFELNDQQAGPVTATEANTTEADIIKQALESSGLPSQHQNSERAQKLQQNQTIVQAADGVTYHVFDSTENVIEDRHVPISLLERLPANKREGVIATMAIHDTATGSLKRHIIRKVNGVRWHQCTYCTKEFKKPSDLVRHVRIHTHEKPYKCTQCFRAFAVKSTLTAHVKTHSGVKDFRCQICEKHFSTHGSLKVHLRLHTGVRPFECPHCDKRFRTSGHRKTHIESHLREDNQPNRIRPPRRIARPAKPSIPLPDIPLQEPIVITDAGFVQPPAKDGIEPYLGVEHGIDRPYRCNFCRRGFKKSSHLKQHIRSHTGEKPYKCLQCFKSFVSSGVLKAHIRTHAGIKAFRCIVCDVSFTTKGSLKRHISVHSENRPFMCPYCQKTFKRSVYCKKHMKIHKAELAMQALQQQQQQQLEAQPETEVTIGGDEEEDVGDVIDDDNMQFLQVNQDAQNNFTLQQDINQGIQISQDMQLSQDNTVPQTDLIQLDQASSNPQQLLDTAIVSDVQLQSALHQQGLQGGQVILTQETVQQINQQQQQQQQHQPQDQQQQQTFVTQQITQLSDGSFFVDTGPPQIQQLNLTNQGALDVVSLAQVANVPGNSLETANMQAILQAEEATEATLAEADLEGAGVDYELVQTTLQEAEAGTVDDEPYAVESSATGGTYCCTFCSKAFRTSAQLKQHLRMHTDLEADGVDYEVVQNTLQEAENTVDDEPYDEESPATGPRNYRCNYCNKAFKKSSHLKQHTRMHTGEKPYHCYQCGKYFVSAGVLKAHQKTHTGVKEFQCKVCHAEFTTNGSLTRHMVSHTTQKAYQCPHCSETFKTAVLAKKHIKQHTIQKVEEVEVTRRTRSTAVLLITDEQADILAKTNLEADMPLSEKILIESAAERSRVSEMKGATGERERRTPGHSNQCPHCVKSFKKPSDLLRHIRIHTGEKPYECEICLRSFTVKSTLDSHLKTHSHLEKSFRCHVCNSSFSTKGSLKVHMRLHTGAKPFVCPHCNARFRTSGHRKSHVQQHYRSASNLTAAKKVISRKSEEVQVQPNQEQSLLKPGIVSEEVIAEPIESVATEPQVLSTSQPTVSVDQGVGVVSPVIQLDPMTLGQAQGVLPVSLSITDSFGNVADPNVTAQVLQGLEGIQLQLTGGQGIQITGLDANMVAQPLQIDPNLLQQLHQQGNVSVTINPGMVTQQLPAADPNLVQNLQLDEQNQVALHAQQSMGEVVNPNVIIQQGGVAQPEVLPVIQQTFQHKVENEEDTVRLDVSDPDATAAMIDSNTQANSQSFVGDTTQESSTSQVQEDSKAQVIYEKQDNDLKPVQHLPASTVPSQENVEIVQTQSDSASSTLTSPNQSITVSVPFVQGKTFATNTTVPQATVADDSAERIHKCQICNKGFKRPSHLKEHLLIHDMTAQQRPKPAATQTCHHCQKTFQKPSQLERHIRIHTGERPFQCGTCMKCFNQKNALLIHLKKHTGEKPHACEYCGQSFTQKGNLKTHVKRHHHTDMIHTMRTDMIHTMRTDDVAGPTPLPGPVTLKAAAQGNRAARTQAILLGSDATIIGTVATSSAAEGIPPVELDDLPREILQPDHTELMPIG